MSWLELNRTGVGRRLAIAALTMALAGCFRPLYGPTASGQPLSEALAAIEIEPVSVGLGQERVSHYLRSELVFALDGSGRPAPKQYKLELAMGERIQSPIVDEVTGRADTATLTGEVTYRLTSLDGKRIITNGKAVGSASYERSANRFATVRAARDADIRLAKVLADQLRTRLAAALATGTGS
jgi:LPS-assembly lipoprotein